MVLEGSIFMFDLSLWEEKISKEYEKRSEEKKILFLEVFYATKTVSQNITPVKEESPSEFKKKCVFIPCKIWERL